MDRLRVRLVRDVKATVQVRRASCGCCYELEVEAPDQSITVVIRPEGMELLLADVCEIASEMSAELLGADPPTAGSQVH